MALSRDELKKVYAERAKTIGTRARSAFAETIVESLTPNRLTMDVVRYFLNFETLNPGDNIRRQVRKGKYITRSFVPGQDLLTEKVPPYQEKYLFMNDWVYAGVSADTWAIQSGDVDSIDKMRSDLAADITEAMAQRAFNTLSSVWNATDTPSNYVDASSTGLTASILDAAIENEIDEVGGVRAIVGTRTALLPVYKLSGYREITRSVGTASTILPVEPNFTEYENSLKVSSYHGVPLVEIPNTRRNNLPNIKEKVVDTTKVLIIGETPGTFYQYGGIEYQDSTDVSRIPSVYNLYAWVRYAMLIDALEAITLVKVSAS